MDLIEVVNHAMHRIERTIQIILGTSVLIHEVECNPSKETMPALQLTLSGVSNMCFIACSNVGAPNHQNYY